MSSSSGLLLLYQMKFINLVGIFFILNVIFSSVLTFKLSKVIVPPHKFHGESAVLECPYDIGKERLYSVKWYKVSETGFPEEFFRYVPKQRPSIRVHNVDGVHVNIEESDKTRVYLKNLDIRSTGIYRCEVSGEGPNFLSKSAEARMTVVHLPQDGPSISTNVRDRDDLQGYEAGEILDLNCTSQESFPPAKIQWFLNDRLVENPDHVIHHSPKGEEFTSIHFPIAPASTISNLRLPLKVEHFEDGKAMKVRCVARISTVFYEEDDEKIVGNSHIHKYSPEVRSTSAFNNESFEDNREAFLLVRGISPRIAVGNLWIFSSALAVLFICGNNIFTVS